MSATKVVDASADNGSGPSSSGGGGCGAINSTASADQRQQGMSTFQVVGAKAKGVNGTGSSLRKEKIVRCCCDRQECTDDVSSVQHYCSVTGGRSFPWCLTGGDEGFGKKSPCVRCAQVEKA